MPARNSQEGYTRSNRNAATMEGMGPGLLLLWQCWPCLKHQLMQESENPAKMLNAHCLVLSAHPLIHQQQGLLS